MAHCVASIDVGTLPYLTAFMRYTTFRLNFVAVSTQPVQTSTDPTHA